MCQGSHCSRFTFSLNHFKCCSTSILQGNSIFSLLISIMSVWAPTILILGHSFVRRLKDDLAARFDARAAPVFWLYTEC